MGALAHYIETDGLATTTISLVREHSEAIHPPRSLWVPFELGRPFGTPNERDFQRDVLRAVLKLVEEPAGPVIRDYPHEAPFAAADEGWACPLPAPLRAKPADEAEERKERLLSEIALLRPWYHEAVREAGRTAMGVSGLTAEQVEEAALALLTLSRGEEAEVPDGLLQEMPILIRFIADDLKAFYFEAAAAQPGVRRPTPRDLNEWFFRQSVLGSVLYDLRDRLREDEDPVAKLAGRFLVPAAYRQRRPAPAEAK